MKDVKYIKFCFLVLWIFEIFIEEINLIKLFKYIYFVGGYMNNKILRRKGNKGIGFLRGKLEGCFVV